MPHCIEFELSSLNEIEAAATQLKAIAEEKLQTVKEAAEKEEIFCMPDRVFNVIVKAICDIATASFDKGLKVGEIVYRKDSIVIKKEKT